MKFTNVNNVKVYNVNTGKSVPEWLTDRKKRALVKKDVDLQQRVQLIQDFDMPTAATRIKMSRDQQYLMASGVYKPKLKCFETAELGMKFERSLDCEIVQFQILSDDFRKVVFLEADRYVEFHAHFGRYFKTRIPAHGRDMSYHSGSCDLYLCGSSPDLWRLNLESGRFMAPLRGKGKEYNVVKISPAHQLITSGSTTGGVEVWDPRTKELASGLRLPMEDNQTEEVTALRYSDDGIKMAVGTSGGMVYMYDIRSDKPFVVKDHQYGYPILDLKFHSSKRVLSTDKRVIKIWDETDGENYTAIESQHDINDTCVANDSGLIMTANEGSDMQAFFIPDLGPAPKWCNFLDTISEELAQTDNTTIYDDYKFVSKMDLETLGLSDLIGSRLLQPYMHGFYMDMRLYQKAKAAVDPFSYKDYRKEAIKKKISDKRANRIGVVKKLPKVNTDYAKFLIQEEAKGESGKKDTEMAGNALKDDRFSSLWSNPEYSVDATSEEFKARHPKLAKSQFNAESIKLIQQNDEEESERDGKGSDESSSESEEEEEVKAPVKKEKKKKTTAPQVNMYEVNAINHEKRRKERKVMLGSRVDEEMGEVRTHAAHVGGRSHTFKMHEKVDHAAVEKEKARKEHVKERVDARRSVKTLNLKRRGPVYWRGQKVE
ncbi:hypothetical protein SARC_04750 [Sphaeroforma arctica JP610]|uniref:Uncharacterized protein n=1 Tax=Sphaeroforma arctica JP610 TaxID=667725 RepID=A0A0L0G2C6_9EUKA|nr:hypothetical protein SARC_04750 [Sphaeroforma arctica JP610]KNC82981.1 hypothetical protein SARC_04750 [Sphaeroforma arctica JP610]|eukprot:XP_014156883.1 hypothetical protein SARC_04750 [Sphaeroforma arctica JP610]